MRPCLLLLRFSCAPPPNPTQDCVFHELGSGLWHEDMTSVCGRFVQNNEWIGMMTKLAAKSTASDMAYWHHINLVGLQLQGAMQLHPKLLSQPRPSN